MSERIEDYARKQYVLDELADVGGPVFDAVRNQYRVKKLGTLYARGELEAAADVIADLFAAKDDSDAAVQEETTSNVIELTVDEGVAVASGQDG